MKIKNNQKGFSLVELMVYVGLLGGVSIFIATLGTNMNKSSVAKEADLRITELMQEFQLKLSKKGACDYNFAGQPSTINPVNSVLNVDGSSIIAINEQIDNFFTVTNIRLDKINNTRADITLSFSRRNTTSSAITSLARKLKLTVVHESDNTTIKSCLANFDLDIGDVMPLLCNGEGTILSDEGTPADTGDDICIHAGYSVEQCPSNEFVKRFELVNIDDGSVPSHLQPYYRPVCAAMTLPVSLSCPPEEILQGYDINNGLICRRLLSADIQKYFQGDYTNCSASQLYSIAQVGANININCGVAIPTPLPTATPSPTATGVFVPAGDCVTVGAGAFVALVPLTTALVPGSTGRMIKITVNGNSHGTPISFNCVGSTDGSNWDLKFKNSLGANWPGVANLNVSTKATMNYFYVERQTGTPLGGCNDCFKCGAMDTFPVPTLAGWGAKCTNAPLGVGGGQGCAFIESGTSPLTGLELLAPLTVCASDAGSSAIMYNHADPFDVY